MRHADVPAMNGRTVVITGTNTGIGRVTAQVLAAAGARVIMLNRSRERSEQVIADLQRTGSRFELVELDLGRLDSVRQAADRVLELAPRIDVLINNAGLAGSRGHTADGFELAFGVNHLGHYLLTALLWPALGAPHTRIVNVSSRAHYRAPGIPWDALQQKTPSTTGLNEYAVSKLANVLFTAELHRRTGGSPHIYALHPGVVATDVWRSIPSPLAWVARQFMASVEDGAQTTLHCAASPATAADSGLYYDNCRPRTPSKWAQDPSLADELWSRSAQWTGIAPDWAGLPPGPE